MPFSNIQIYYRRVLSIVSWDHLVAITILSIVIAVLFIVRKKCSIYGAIVWGFTWFVGLSLVDLAVLIRFINGVTHITRIDLTAEYERLLYGGEIRWAEMLANVAVFIPFGFFLSEFLAETKRFQCYRIGLVALLGLGLSLCIESLQLFFRVGWFEITDLALNTVGAVIGGGISFVGRKVIEGGRFL